MRFPLLLTVLTLLVVPSSGCEDPSGGPCTLDAHPSLLLSTVDAETGEDVNAMVTYLVDGEEPDLPAEKLSLGRYQLGLEADGTFEVTVSADGYEPVTREYEVTSGECHVMTVEATIELVPSS